MDNKLKNKLKRNETLIWFITNGFMVGALYYAVFSPMPLLLSALIGFSWIVILISIPVAFDNFIELLIKENTLRVPVPIMMIIATDLFVIYLFVISGSYATAFGWSMQMMIMLRGYFIADKIRAQN